MNIKLLGVVMLAGAALAGCDKAKEKGDDEKVLSVNGEVLMRSTVDADVEAMMKAQGDKVPAEQKAYYRQMAQNQVAQGFVVEKVLVSKAKADGYTITDADRKAREAEFLKMLAKTPDAPKTMEEYYKKFPLGEARARSEFDNGMLIEKMIKAEQAKTAKVDYAAKAKEVIAGIVSNNNSIATADKDALAKITNLKANTTYYVRVRSFHVFDGTTYYGEWSNVQNEKPTA